MHHHPPEYWENYLVTDEKIWTVDGYFNPQNDRVRARKKADVEAVEGDKFPGKRMVWLGVSARKTTPLVHFTGNVNGKTYQEKVLKNVVLNDVLVKVQHFNKKYFFFLRSEHVPKAYPSINESSSKGTRI